MRLRPSRCSTTSPLPLSVCHNQGVRRVLLEAETKDMGFMVQCEECDVWQHGICMGIEREEDCPDKYYCELCRPDLHPSTM